MLSFVLSLLFKPRPTPRRRPSPPTARAPACVDDGLFHATIPAIDSCGLQAIETRIPGAPVRELRRWIVEVRRQMPDMEAEAREHAGDLLLRLQAALAEQIEEAAQGEQARTP